MSGRLKDALQDELSRAREEETHGSRLTAWSHLERAHILSQPFPLPHVQVHLAMLGFAWRQGWWGEVLGQFPRIVLAGPASALGRAPVGNTGGSNVSLFKPLPVPEDLQLLLDRR